VGLEAAADANAARRAALELLDGVLNRHRPLDDLLDDPSSRFAKLEGRDRAFAHALTATTLRRKGEAEDALTPFLAKPLPKSAGLAGLILLLGAVQLRFLDVPAHAAIHQSVALAQGDHKAKHFAGLINAVLRRVASAPSVESDPRRNVPDWLWQRWSRNYGEEAALSIARAHLAEAPVDINVKRDPALWAERLGGVLLPTGSIRLRAAHVPELPGFAEGAWWVQDAAAALPARLLGDVAGKRIADLCAATGGKAAQLAAAGAQVTAVDSNAARLRRMAENLARLSLSCELVEADILAWEPAAPFDAVLLDAPCSATGTIRRHPDLPYVKSEAQIRDLVKLQTKMLTRAATWVKPGGRLVYCTCSLEPEEGERRIESFLARHSDFRHLAVSPAEIADQTDFINKTNDLRIRPGMSIGSEPGLDGFFAARLERQNAS